MNHYRTVITPSPAPFSISHKDRIVSIGSCFSENIGRKLSDYKFNIQINPFGQQYNPHSVATAMLRLLNPVPYSEKDLVCHDEIYHSFDHHGNYSRPTVQATLETINQHLLKASEDLKQATLLFLTFGTSHFFRLKESGKIVSNCHKLSGSLFERDLMKPEEISDKLERALKELRRINPNIRVILTISPVRYFAFGHYENSVSKGHLFTAVHALQQAHPEYYYFPAYELVMDDLRDYRFFAEDMLHPNYEATNYVWQSLCHTLMDKETRELLKPIEEILMAARHRPRNPNSVAHQKFVKKTLDNIAVLSKQYGLRFEEETARLSTYLK